MLMLMGMAGPVAAAPQTQEGGGVHFGPYTLQPGDRVDGDLVVFGGPVRLGEESELEGDLTVFGPLTLDTGAIVGGQLVVMGSADIDGQVEGDVFSAGALTLRENAYVEGDISTAGNLSQDPEAVVEGDVSPMDEDDWDIAVPGPFGSPGHWDRRVEVSRTPRWLTAIWNLVRGIAGVVLMSLLALIIASLWPAQMERVGRVIEEAPLNAFGVGLLTLILATLAATLLAITICLSPFAFVGMIVVGVGILFGWVALGLILGRRVLTGLFNQLDPKPAVAAILGTALASFILALARTFGLLHTLLIFLLIPPVAGAVLLTRFGTMPYATRGTGGSRPSGPTSGPTGGPSPRPPAPPRPRGPLPSDVATSEPEAEEVATDVSEVTPGVDEEPDRFDQAVEKDPVEASLVYA